MLLNTDSYFSMNILKTICENKNTEDNLSFKDYLGLIYCTDHINVITILVKTFNGLKSCVLDHSTGQNGLGKIDQRYSFLPY